MASLKQCTKCGEWKDAELDFCKHGPDKRRPDCDECRRKRQRAHYQANREELLSRRREEARLTRANDPKVKRAAELKAAGLKECTRCNGVKLFSEFIYRPKSNYKDGYSSWCKDCQLAVSREAGLARYYANREESLAKHREWYSQNRDKARAAMRAWQSQNRAKLTAYQRERYRNDPAVRQRVLESRKRHVARNPEKNRVSSLRYWARKKQASGDFTTEEWIRLCDYYGNRCLACGKQESISIDHIVPLSKGGSNDISNLQPLCLSCNSSKNARTIDYRPSIPAWLKARRAGPKVKQLSFLDNQ